MDSQLELRIGMILSERKQSLVTAESCTGGLIASRITDVAGSSAYFLGGIVAYSYEVKAALLGVSWDTLNNKGAVSRETVIEMARGARNILKADIAVSVSGIAGPGGGTPDKPVGTVWVGLATPSGEEARHFVWDGDRVRNKYLSSEAALQFVLDYLEGNVA
ncbi:MAG TPA: CinA family protein [Anaerolineales bacterium]|nr:CinA family protein [Anaerolineales bacterium]